MTDGKLQYKVGDKAKSGEEIDFIYGHSTSLIVYRDKNGAIQYETVADTLSSTEIAVHAYYDRLHARVKAYLPEAQRGRFTEAMGQALFLALSESQQKDALSHFETVAGEFAQEVQILARFKYVRAGSVAVATAIAVGMLVSLCPADAIKDLARAGAIGAAGAWVSIVGRASRLELGPFEMPKHLQQQGVTRILLGIGFGMVTVTAIHAGVLLGNVTNTWMIGLAIFVGGFSERLIPELITRVESRTASASISPTRSATH